MRIYLCGDPESQETRDYDKVFANLSNFNKMSLKSEATEIKCVNFLSSFDYYDVEKVLLLICSKIRIGGSLVIVDTDADLMARLITLHGIRAANDMVKTGFKSFITMEYIKSIIPDGIELSHVKLSGVKFTLTAQRSNNV